MCDYVRNIKSKENNDIFLLGLSVGGMLAYQVASIVKGINGIIATTLVDPRDQETLVAISKNKMLATYGLKLMITFRHVTDHFKLPIKWFCKMNLMSHNKNLSNIFIEDKLSGGVHISLRFLRTFTTYHPAIEFEQFDHCPILLLLPEKDEWTPHKLSMKVLDKIPGQTELKILKECGHAPIEEPGITTMEKEALKFINDLASA